MTQASFNNFSDRFHLLCDQAGFVTGRGRQTEVYRFFGVSQVTARNWLSEGFCPRHKTLRKNIMLLKDEKRLPENVSPEVLHVWLEKGDSYIPNPFAASTADEGSSELPSLNTYKIFRIVATQLDELGIDIDSYPENQANDLLAELSNENLTDKSSKRAQKIVRDRLNALRANSAQSICAAE